MALSNEERNESRFVVPTRIKLLSGLNAKTVAKTDLYTVQSGTESEKFLPLYFVIRVEVFTVGSKSVQAVASFGGNSSTYDDLINSQTFTVSAVDQYIIADVPRNTALPMMTPGTEVKISIETGSDATVETWGVDVFGYFQ